MHGGSGNLGQPRTAHFCMSWVGAGKWATLIGCGSSEVSTIIVVPSLLSGALLLKGTEEMVVVEGAPAAGGAAVDLFYSSILQYVVVLCIKYIIFFWHETKMKWNEEVVSQSRQSAPTRRRRVVCKLFVLLQPSNFRDKARWRRQKDLRRSLLVEFITHYIFYSYADSSIWYSRSLLSPPRSRSQNKLWQPLIYSWVIDRNYHQ